MKCRILMVLVVALGLVSCQQESRWDEKKLYGDWLEEIRQPDSLLPYFPMYRSGFLFEKGGYCEVKPFHYVTGKDTLRPMIGPEGSFSIKGDSLLIEFNDSIKVSYKIGYLGGDTLKFAYKEGSRTFIKQHYEKLHPFEFDEVIVSAGVCYGSCPINDVHLKKTGELDFLGHSYNKRNGSARLKLKPAELNHILARFRKIDYSSLKSSYSKPITDGATCSIAFIKNGTVVKSVEDYWIAGPPELVFAYMPLNYYSQNIPDHLFTENIGPGRGDFQVTGKRRSFSLTAAESYFLKKLLRSGQSSIIKFTPGYKLQCGYITIMSDGQHFTYNDSLGERVTVDIGHNFFGENKLVYQTDKP